MDVVLLHEGEEVVILLEQRVSLDLVDDWCNASRLDASLDVRNAEVRDAHGAGLRLGKLDHGYNAVSQLGASRSILG
jgi:hypothetical protein